MRRTLSSLLLGSSVFLTAAPALAFRDINPPEDVLSNMSKHCTSLSEEDRDRCINREKQRWAASQRMLRTPTKDFEFRDAQDFGMNHLRNDLKAQRIIDMRKGVQGRKTYRQLEPKADLNTERRSYLNTLRMGQLKCQLQEPGRARSICMDQLGNWARKQMQETSGAKKYPAGS